MSEDRKPEKVNIIGAGLSGLSAAITLAQKGLGCNLISVQPSERAQSVLAEGGINAALNTMGENDDPEEHFKDTMRGGVDLADPNAVAGLVYTAPEIVTRFLKLGVPFHLKNGNIVLRNFGGQKKKRTAYAKSSSGKILMTALIDEARKYEAEGLIQRYPHHEAIGILFDEDRKCCDGVKVIDLYTNEMSVFGGMVILCSGGLAGIFPEMTTGTVQNTGNLSAELFASGVEFANLEFLQYHPTTVGISGKRMLISEAARGEGGRLCVMREGRPWYFMEELYPELGNLMPRDVVSREMVKVCAREDCEDQVYLDMTGLSKETWNQKLSDLREEILDYFSIDPAKELIPVKPGIHYFMGGIYVNENHETNIECLFAAGECACQYHGANRLGGNSMLGAVYGGKVAAERAAELIKNNKERTVLKTGLTKKEEDLFTELIVSADNSKQIRDILLSGLGIIRSGEAIENALMSLEHFGKMAALSELEKKRLLLGKAMLLSARERRESRGAHTRSDHPEKNEEQFRKTTVAKCVAGHIDITFRDIPERRMADEYHS